MSQQNRISKARFINPTFFVFCEGKTEEQYINYLRTKYRLPIQIVAKTSGNRITNTYIDNFKDQRKEHEKDRTYLMFDLDAPKMMERLLAIKDTILLCSNPCFELWLLLHHQEQKAEITSDVCIENLIFHHKGYSKGNINDELKSILNSNQEKACHRASKLSKYNNPSSTVHKLIEDLEKVKNEKH
jgi:hypothetical protein